jgi:hypothetical protein
MSSFYNVKRHAQVFFVEIKNAAEMNCHPDPERSRRGKDLLCRQKQVLHFVQDDKNA